ncbi:MAG TPA: hypothetical protein VFK06_17500 [Candidatus Angelobacter sp.]|nr:hypothetical protein [Candidatus Angelobacter sp.]
MANASPKQMDTTANILNAFIVTLLFHFSSCRTRFKNVINLEALKATGEYRHESIRVLLQMKQMALISHDSHFSGFAAQRNHFSNCRVNIWGKNGCDYSVAKSKVNRFIYLNGSVSIL